MLCMVYAYEFSLLTPSVDVTYEQLRNLRIFYDEKLKHVFCCQYNPCTKSWYQWRKFLWFGEISQKFACVCRAYYQWYDVHSVKYDNHSVLLLFAHKLLMLCLWVLSILIPNVLLFFSIIIVLSYRWQYFGAVEGLVRLYPGREWSVNFAGFYKDYDPRVSPWFIAATSGPKDVVIILDCRYYNKNKYK